MTSTENINAILENTQVYLNWMAEHLGMILLVSCVFFLWIAVQALALHYYFFYRESKKPRTEFQRVKRLENWIMIQKDQIDQLFGELQNLQGALKEKSRADMRDTMQRAARADSTEGTSVESSFMTLGELQLKQKIDALRSRPKAN